MVYLGEMRYTAKDSIETTTELEVPPTVPVKSHMMAFQLFRVPVCQGGAIADAAFHKMHRGKTGKNDYLVSYQTYYCTINIFLYLKKTVHMSCFLTDPCLKTSAVFIISLLVFQAYFN